MGDNKKMQPLKKAAVAALLLTSLISASVLVARYTHLECEAADFRALASFSTGCPQKTDILVQPLSPTETVMPKPLVAGEETILDRYAALHKKNGDLIGWFEIEGTRIDYPVMYTPADGDYYIDKDFNKKPSAGGALFADARSSFQPLSDNIIIYGHNMKNSAMFGALLDYKDEDFFKLHRIIRFDTIYERGEYEIIAAFYSRVYRKTDDCFKFYSFVDAENKKDYNFFIEQIKTMSIYDTGETAAYGDTLITLVTCAYHVQNGRFVVVAKKITDSGS